MKTRILSLFLFCLSPAVPHLLAEEPKPAPAPADAPKVKPYPLDTCIVSDEKLDSMGKPYTFTHEGQEIKLCCKPCLKKFQKEPAKYLEKLKKK